jgi:hypothetical protein
MQPTPVGSGVQAYVLPSTVICVPAVLAAGRV